MATVMLSVASSDAIEPATGQPKTQTAAPGTTVERPKLVAHQQATKDPATADKPADVVREKRRHVPTEARIIYELHRHGIYW
jgi:hypothetical protein